MILEEKHETSLTNQIVLEQEQLSETNRNQIKQLEAEIELLESETNKIISENTQQAKDDAAGERATLKLGRLTRVRVRRVRGRKDAAQRAQVQLGQRH